MLKSLIKLGAIATLSLTITNVPEGVRAQDKPSEASSSSDVYSPESEYDQYMRLGYAAQQQQDYRNAATYFRYALYYTPGDREATIAYWNTRAELQSTDLSETSAQYEQSMEQGYDATEQGDYETALSSFQAALQYRPNDYYATQAIRNVTTYINRGVEADSPTDVSPTYSVYIGERPYDRYMRLGYAAVQRQDFSTAQQHFRSALYERPSDRQATIAYWNAVDAIQDDQFGLNSSEPESRYDRYMRLGYDATERGNYVQALTFFERALAERPEDGYATQAIRNVNTYSP